MNRQNKAKFDGPAAQSSAMNIDQLGGAEPSSFALPALTSPMINSTKKSKLTGSMVNNVPQKPSGLSQLSDRGSGAP